MTSSDESKTKFQVIQESYPKAVPHTRAMQQEITDLAPGFARMRMQCGHEHLGDVEAGLIHSSVILSLMDSVFGASVLTVLENFESIATLDMRADYFAPAFANSVVVAEAQVLRSARHISFVTAKIWQETEPEKIIATGQAAFMRGANSARMFDKQGRPQ